MTTENPGTETGTESAAQGHSTDGTPWRIAGDWWDLCNCAIGCPCIFGSEPTHGFCEGVLTWLIREGNYGDVSLDGGLAVVLIIHFEGSVFEKNRPIRLPTVTATTDSGAITLTLSSSSTRSSSCLLPTRGS